MKKVKFSYGAHDPAVWVESEGYAVGEHLVIEKQGPTLWVLQHLPSGGRMPITYATRTHAKQAADRLVTCGESLDFKYFSQLPEADKATVRRCL